MNKLLSLALNKYLVVPHSLRENKAINSPVSKVSVSLASLYHHYYLDSFGKLPPSPDPAQFEHVHFLLPTKDFRFQGTGLGVAPAIKKHRSNELGQAFCRWFLHDHFNITYFAHMEHILGRQLHRAFDGCRIDRDSKGDTPDYFCAESVDQVFLAEAKGRYSSISFKNKEFDSWRKQFDRVVFKDATGTPRRIKGHIVASRFVTEQHSPRLLTGLWAEDPASPGDIDADAETTFELGASVIASHYSGISTKLGQPLLASSLTSGVQLPEEILIRCVAWKVIAGPLQGKRFVGGYFVSPTADIPHMQDLNGRICIDRCDPLRLDIPSATFFGIEESIFREVVALARFGARTITQVQTFDSTDFFYSGFSVLRDGSALGPVDFFTPDEQIIL